jgi:type IX secretion system PorP/SprF family membrane protein
MKRHTPIYGIIIMLVCMTTAIFAQQDPHFTKYMYKNQSLYNPAATGRTGDYHAGLAYRLQWIGIEGAPSTMAGNFETSLDNNRAGLGFNFYHDKIGFDNSLSLQLNYAYRLFMNENATLSLGIKGGAQVYFSDFADAVTSEGPDPLHVRNNIWIPRVGLGLMFYTKQYFISVSAPALAAYVPKSSFLISDDAAYLSKHFYGSAGYIINLKKDVLQLKPFVFAKYHPSAPFQLDLGMQLWYKDVFSVGGSYRTGDAISAMVEIPIIDGLNFSYAYDYTNSLFRQIGSGAHEIVIDYTWNKKKPRIPSIHKISNLPRF